MTAEDPFVGIDNLTGPNPPGGPLDGGSGAINLDPFLTQYAATPTMATLNVVSSVPEPSTMAFGVLAAAGLAAGAGGGRLPASRRDATISSTKPNGPSLDGPFFYQLPIA